jgi:hypothetical protein
MVNVSVLSPEAELKTCTQTSDGLDHGGGFLSHSSLTLLLVSLSGQKPIKN